MIRIGLIKEGKTPPDTRVALTPEQCAEIQKKLNISIIVEPSPDRCYSDEEYLNAGIQVSEDLSSCDVLLGVKEVPVNQLLEGKTYMFFSHTKKKQPYNKPLMQALIQKKIRLIDYECLTHADGQRILGFGYFAGLIGAHNGLLTYGKKFNLFHLRPAYTCRDFEEMVKQYKEVILPPVKIAITGSGKVAAGILEIMNQFDVESMEPQDFLNNRFDYPVYTHLKGNELYARKDDNSFSRENFHRFPQDYKCLFGKYLSATDILMNGIYWTEEIPKLFEKEDVRRPGFNLKVISDITCDIDGSVPINLGASSISDPVYGIHKKNLEKAAPFQNTGDIVDIMAVDNLPNELPRDASESFGQHLRKFVLEELAKGDDSDIIARATICSNGRLTSYYEYLSDYAY